MEIESFWNGLPGYKGTCKGRYGKIGYGFIYKHYAPHRDTNKRKAYRQIRKMGFDESEVWSLDSTIQEWLSDNVGGFFKICGDSDEWINYNLNGEYYDYWEHRDEPNHLDIINEWAKIRYDSFVKHLKDFLDNSNEDTLNKFRKFIIPRLRLLAKVSHGWPQCDNYPNYEDWIEELNNMANKFEQGTYAESFIKHFFDLWD